MMAASSSAGRRVLRGAGPIRAERQRELLRFPVAVAGKGVDPSSLRARHLRHDMTGRAKTVDADRLARAGHDQGSPADQPGAEQRRQRRVVALFAEREAVSRVGDEVAGKAAVARVAGEFGMVAEIFLSARQ